MNLEPTLTNLADQDPTTWADRLGICLSALCVVHCLLTPIVLLLLPSVSIFGLSGLVGLEEFHESFHQILLLILPLLALSAFIPGYRRHRSLQVFYWSVPGFVLLVAAVTIAHGAPLAEAGLSVVGSVLLIQAHIVNRRLCACCQTHACSPRRRVREARDRGGVRYSVPSPKSKRLLARPKPRA